jgi:hypothetical protein
MATSNVKAYWKAASIQGKRILLYAHTKPKEGYSDFITLRQAKAWALKKYGIVGEKRGWIVYPLRSGNIELEPYL